MVFEYPTIKTSFFVLFFCHSEMSNCAFPGDVLGTVRKSLAKGTKQGFSFGFLVPNCTRKKILAKKGYKKCQKNWMKSPNNFEI